VVPAQNKQETACPVVKLEAERLPDLNIPRSGYGSKGDTISSPVADRLKGEAISIPLMEEWRFLPTCHHTTIDVSFIGDKARGIYTYLLPVEDENGQTAIARVANGTFSLLPTACTIPMNGPWGSIHWCSTVLADSLGKKAYLLGMDKDHMEHPDQMHHLYVLTIDYAVEPASLTLGRRPHGHAHWRPS